MTSGQCFNCLRMNHKSKQCQVNKSCRFCKWKHHQSICDKPGTRDTEQPRGTDSNRGDKTTANTTNNAKNQQTVLLQTAKVMAFGDLSKQLVPARVLFDNGSQLSYVTEHLMTQLNLKPTKVEKIHLNTFGATGYKHSLARLLSCSCRNWAIRTQSLYLQ